MALQDVCMQSGLCCAQTLTGSQDVYAVRLVLCAKTGRLARCVYAVRFVLCAQIVEGSMEGCEQACTAWCLCMLG